MMRLVSRCTAAAASSTGRIKRSFSRFAARLLAMIRSKDSTDTIDREVACNRGTVRIPASFCVG